MRDKALTLLRKAESELRFCQGRDKIRAQISRFLEEKRPTATELANSLQEMLDTYAPNADKTAKAEGEEVLHSVVKRARALLRRRA